MYSYLSVRSAFLQKKPKFVIRIHNVCASPEGFWIPDTSPGLFGSCGAFGEGWKFLLFVFYYLQAAFPFFLVLPDVPAGKRRECWGLRGITGRDNSANPFPALTSMAGEQDQDHLDWKNPLKPSNPTIPITSATSTQLLTPPPGQLCQGWASFQWSYFS